MDENGATPDRVVAHIADPVNAQGAVPRIGTLGVGLKTKVHEASQKASHVTIPKVDPSRQEIAIQDQHHQKIRLNCNYLLIAYINTGTIFL